MKRKLLLSLVALCGGLTIVGSGFSAWYFSVDKLETTNSINHYVTDLNNGIGTLTDKNKDQSLYLILDQGGYQYMDDATHGVSITKVPGTASDKNTGDLVSQIGVNYGITVADATTLVGAGIKTGTLTATLKFTDVAQKYLTFKSFGTAYAGGDALPKDEGKYSLDVAATTITYKYTVDFEAIATGTTDYSKDFLFDSSTTNGVNAMIQYFDADYEASGAKQKPQSKDAYNAMKTALSDATLLNIAYTFEVTLPTK